MGRESRREVLSLLLQRNKSPTQICKRFNSAEGTAMCLNAGYLLDFVRVIWGNLGGSSIERRYVVGFTYG